MLDTNTREALRQAITALRADLIEDFDLSTRSRYHLDVPDDALDDAQHADTRRARALLDQWLDEQARADLDAKALAALAAQKPAALAQQAALRARHLRRAQLEVAATWLHRLVLLRQLEALGLRKVRFLTGGWGATAYKDLASAAPDLCLGVDKGYAFFLGLVMDELAVSMPGLFGHVGLTGLLPLPHGALRAIVNLVNLDALEPAWTDDMTLGWIYQYWNDPSREDLDKKINDGGKIAPHEVASKTQMFTDRYMVQWLLHNTVNPWWLAICQRNRWTPEATQRGLLDNLDARRAQWRRALADGQQPPDAPLDLLPGDEARWCWYVPRPTSDAMRDAAPQSLRGLRLLDPACGSGHFLVLALEQLFGFYQEEARRRGEAWTPQEIVAWIVEENLHGLELDPRAAQSAAASLWLKAQVLAPGARIGKMNIVATDFSFARLPPSDPARVEFRDALWARVGVEPIISDAILAAIAEASHAGSLVRVERGIDAALTRGGLRHNQTDLLIPAPEQAREGVMDALERFLADSTSQHDLGLQLKGEQLTAGARFVRLVQPAQYHVVFGNPPYQGASRLEDPAWLKKHYPAGKADLFAAFLLRGLELTRPGGLSGLLTMRNWMFIKTYQDLREAVLSNNDLDVLLDLDRGAFAEVHNDILAVSIAIFCKTTPTNKDKPALQPTPITDTSYDKARTARKEALTLAQVGRFDFQPQALRGVEGWPLIYWWDNDFIQRYISHKKLGDVSPAALGLSTSNNPRFIRRLNEVNINSDWVPLVSGAAGAKWFTPMIEVMHWSKKALALKLAPGAMLRNVHNQFKLGIAFTPVGANFYARAHKYKSVTDAVGRSVFPDDIKNTLMLMNSSYSKSIMESLNPSISFTAGDVNRLPVWEVRDAGLIYDTIEGAFDEHERHREGSVEFKAPGRSCWTWAQAWAQRMVDRGPDDPWEPFAPEYDAPQPIDFVSFAFGVALGRFGGSGEGVLEPSVEAPNPTLPRGLLFLSGYRDQDSLQHPACAPLLEAWGEHARALCEGSRSASLKEFLRERLFKERVRPLYENRPIWWPLSSSKRSFVAWVSIHRMDGDTLPALLADHLIPERDAIEAERKALEGQLAQAQGKEKAALDKRMALLVKLAGELEEFIKEVTRCAFQGAPYPSGGRAPEGRAEAVTFDPVLDDGVMINSGALWPLLEPQWRDPRGWFKELCEGSGRKDYDWSRLAARLYPARVEAKCAADPSLAVAHGCFWRHHPALAYEWELRLQHELADATFTLDEVGSELHRERFLAHHPDLAATIEAREHQRRARAAPDDDAADDAPDDDDA